jgi:hypothetical protein
MMIVNNLIIKLKNRTTEDIAMVRDLLLSLDGRIPELLSVEVKTDVRGPEKSDYDLMMISKFNSLEDFAVYLGHPVHVAVANRLNEAMASACSLRYSV